MRYITGQLWQPTISQEIVNMIAIDFFPDFSSFPLSIYFNEFMLFYAKQSKIHHIDGDELIHNKITFCSKIVEWIRVKPSVLKIGKVEA